MLRELQHPYEHRWNPLTERHTEAFDEPQGFPGVKVFHDDACPTKSLHREIEAQRGCVIERRGGEIDAVRSCAVELRHEPHERRHAARGLPRERRFHALRAPCRTRGVEQVAPLELTG